MKTHLISADDLSKIVASVGIHEVMDATIQSLRDICVLNTQGKFEIPQRSGFHYQQPELGLVEWMPALRIGEHIVVKMVGYHPQNPQQRNLPTILSTLLVFDTETGHLSSLADGTFATAIRTGAASALASSYLQSRSAKTLGLVGAGAQAVTQVHALSRVMDIETVLVFDSNKRTCHSFAERGRPLVDANTSIRPASLAEIASLSDVICTATSVEPNAGPVIQDLNLLPHVHINAVGSDFPGKTELPLSLVTRALVVPDFAEQALSEGESQVLNQSQLGPDLCSMVSDPELTSHYRNQVTVFDSTGFALEDYAVAMLLTQYARDLNCGEAVNLESIGVNSKNPYGFLLQATKTHQSGQQ